MSTSATQSGTTTGAGRSGKGLGFAAAALAVVIAAGFVFALNQGNQATVSDASVRAAEIAENRYAEMVRQYSAAFEASTRPDPAAELERLNDLAARLTAQENASAEIDRLNDLAVQVQAQSHPAFNIEKTKMGLAGTLDAPQVVPDADILEYKRLLAEQLAASRAIEHPAISPEQIRMGMLTENFGEAVYVPSIVLPVEVSTIRNGFDITWSGDSSRSEGNLDTVRAQTDSRQPAELNQPEWDNRMP
jgi:hypothetical protein